RLYLETTIPSYLVARPSRDLRLSADQFATHEWWDECREDYELFISQMVIKESRRGDPELAALRLAQMADIPLLSDLHEAAELAKRLLADRIVPEVAADDATHIALAAAHGMDYLLTWNCKHINNHRIRTRIEQACEAAGLVCPDICTPAELMKLP
ncbi:MAG: type II toxin-antitoxin system VapC family toxin, partial [Chthoniobacteraceae bacterium]